MSKNNFSKLLILFTFATAMAFACPGLSHEAWADTGEKSRADMAEDAARAAASAASASSLTSSSSSTTSTSASSASAASSGGGGGESFGQMLCYAFNNAKSFGFIFEIIAYCCGVLSALKGVYHLKLHADNPASNKIGVGISYLFGSMALLALPEAISALEQSIGYTTQASGGSTALACGHVGPVSAAEGLDQVVTNFVLNFKEPLTSIASIVAILAGLFMIVNGLIKASKYGSDPRTYSAHSILTNLGFGAILMTIGQMLPMMVFTLFGTEEIAASSVLHWTKLSALIGGDGVSKQFIAAVTSALTFVQVIGAIAFVRGWLILKKVVEGGGNVSLTQGLTHILGGVLAINIFAFLRVMDSTFGINLLN